MPFPTHDFTLDDFLRQLDQIRRLGGMGDILRSIPGMGSLAGSITYKCDAEGEMRKIQGMIHAMTPAERGECTLMISSRLQRIARGSGTTIQEIMKLLDDFQKMKLMMRNFVNCDIQQRLLNEMRNSR